MLEELAQKFPHRHVKNDKVIAVKVDEKWYTKKSINIPDRFYIEMLPTEDEHEALKVLITAKRQQTAKNHAITRELEIAGQEAQPPLKFSNSLSLSKMEIISCMCLHPH